MGKAATKPTLVRVLGKCFSINFVDEVHPKLEGNLGMCMKQEQQIYINNCQPPAEEGDTVLHEVMHAVDHVMGTKLTEKQITRMATGIFGMLQDNQEFAKWLIKDRSKK